MSSAVSAATCDLCGRRFENAYQLGPHKKACWTSWFGKDCSSPEFSCSSEEEEEVAAIGVATSAATPGVATSAATSTQVAPATPLWELARRDKSFGIVQRVVWQGTGLFNADLSFDYVAVSKI